jgi:ribosomal protein L30E
VPAKDPDKRKAYQSRYHKDWYLRNKEARTLYIFQRQESIKRTVQNYKLAAGCSICGYNRCSRALEFHHTGDDKEYTISRIVGQGRSIEKIMEEVKKCVVVCANCHAEIHSGDLV